jgi:hypothetical protein
MPQYSQALLIAAIALFMAACPAYTQPPDPSPTPDLPEARVHEVRKLPGGAFLFVIRLYAAPGKPLKLMRPPPRRPPSAEPREGDDDPLPFSLAESTLKDLFTNKTYEAYPLLPKKPYLGPLEITGALAPGGWTQLSVAFPPIPDPPLDEKGHKQPYQLLFSIPELKLETSLLLDPETLQPIRKTDLKKAGTP